nr:CPBP family intramembrane glutamic endopeptidase [Amycolatopsis lexingtonensis]
MASRPGSRRFHTLTASVAATWFAGAGRVPRGRPDVVQPLVVGAGAFGVFYGCALVARHIPPLRRAITGVLDHAHRGSTPSVAVTALVTGVAEEAFFRGALYDAFGARGATAAYVLSTTATRNPALVLASAVMGALFAAQRHRAGGVQAPMLTHVAWSALMLAAMPRLFPPED